MNRKNLSEDGLAEVLGISSEMLYNLLHAYIEPNDRLLTKIAKYFDLPRSYLTGVPDAANMQGAGHKYRNDAYNVLVPIVKASRVMSPLVKEADILSTVNLTVKEGFNNNEYIGIMIEHNTNVGSAVFKSGEAVMVNVSNQILNGDTVAYNKLGKPVEFRKYMRSGPMITLYSFDGEPPLSFRVGDTEYAIIGPVRKSEILR
ncbi:MAG: helix-turn-helix transcriptional regulator [Clostridia bacterium]|nr:helix-turn-helix transcriptional regulator [Clostridia bacterium]